MGEITVCVDGVGGLCELISGHLELNSVTGISNILVFIGAEPSVNNTVHGRGAVGVEVGGETVDDSVKHLLVVIVIYHHSFFRDIITSRLILSRSSSIILNDFVAVIVILRLLRESLGLGDTELGGVLGLASKEGNWRLSVIADNLTNERIKVIGGTLPLARTFVQLASGGALDGIGYDAIYARPRNITFKLDYNF